MKPNPIVSTVDFDADGIRHGHLRLPWSRDKSAWGSVMIPVTVAKNGDGPTALLTGGNHGDEYEGPIALADLAATLEPKDLTGRAIIVPFMNYPAFRAGRRVSPIDGANLNRIFPGKPDGTISEKIADYFQRTLLPMADYVLDFHSGGRSLDFLPFAAAHVLDDKTQEARCFAARDAFGAPYSLALREIDAVGMYDSAAEALGKVFVTTEIGGGGGASAASAAIAKRGVRNFLKHAGILAGAIEASPSVVLDMPSDDCFTFADSDGMVEYLVELGGAVAAGDVVARVHDTLRTGTAPLEHRVNLDGILVARRALGLTAPGDCLAVVAIRSPA